MFSLNILETKVEIHASIFILLAIIIFLENSIFAFSVVLFSFAHEIAHTITAKYLGYTPQKISFGLFGGVLHIRQGFINPKDELLIHLTGPFFNLLSATALYAAALCFHIGWFEPLIFANILLALFNLMPFYPLDGGKIISLYFAFFLGYGRAQKFFRVLSRILTFLLFILGIYLVQYNLVNLLISILAINLYITGKQDNSFIFYKVSQNINQRPLKDREKILVCLQNAKAAKALEKCKPLDNIIFTIVSEKGSYLGQLTMDEVMDGIYSCGIYADFSKLLENKRNKE